MDIKIKKSGNVVSVETVDGTFKFQKVETKETELDFGKGTEIDIIKLLKNTFSNALNNPQLIIEVENDR